MNQTFNLGMSVGRRPNRCIDSENDIYVPMLTNMRPIKIIDNDRLWYACMHHQIERIKQLLLDPTIDIFHIYSYHSTIIKLICSTNMGDNIMYSYNQEGYHDVLFTLLENIKTTHLITLLNMRHVPLLGKGNIVRINPLGINGQMCHYIFVLINYGLIPTTEEIKNIPFEQIRIFLQSEKGQKFINCPNKLGTKYEILMDTCPITLDSIENPAITVDGHVFEFEAINRFLADGNNKNPVTNQQLLSPYLYLPKEKKFVIAKNCYNNLINLNCIYKVSKKKKKITVAVFQEALIIDIWEAMINKLSTMSTLIEIKFNGIKLQKYKPINFYNIKDGDKIQFKVKKNY